MLIFQIEEKDYHGASALEVVRKMEFERKDYPFQGQSIRQFLTWSFERLADCFPPRDLDLSDRMGAKEKLPSSATKTKNRS